MQDGKGGEALFYGTRDRRVNRVRGLNPLDNIPFGHCHCGCGGLTSIAKYDREERGQVKGKPMRFLSGHNAKSKTYITNQGYVFKFAPDHPRTSTRGYVLEHILVMESVIGGPIPEGMVVHHRDKVKTNNDPSNLQLMTAKDHSKLHALLNASQLGAENRRCSYCKMVDHISNMSVNTASRHYFHRKCKSAYWKLHRPSRAKKQG